MEKKLERLLRSFINKEVQIHPSGVMLCITSKCNLKCRHCYNNSGAEKKIIGDKQWRELVYKLKKLNLKKFSISGGEPLLRKNLIYDLLEIIEKSDIDITTNGYYIDEEFLYKIQKNNSRITLVISLDGHNVEMNKITRGESKAWEKTVNAIKLVQNFPNLNLQVNHTVNKENKDYIEEFLRLMIQLNVKNVLVGPVAPIGRAEENKLEYVLSMKERINLITQIRQLKEKYKDKLEIQVGTPGGYFDIINFLTNPVDWLVIDSIGDVLLNIRLPYVVGNVFIDPIDNIWKKILKLEKNEQLINEIIDKCIENMDVTSDKKIYLDLEVIE